MAKLYISDKHDPDQRPIDISEPVEYNTDDDTAHRYVFAEQTFDVDTVVHHIEHLGQKLSMGALEDQSVDVEAGQLFTPCVVTRPQQFWTQYNLMYAADGDAEPVGGDDDPDGMIAMTEVDAIEHVVLVTIANAPVDEVAALVLLQSRRRKVRCAEVRDLTAALALLDLPARHVRIYQHVHRTHQRCARPEDDHAVCAGRELYPDAVELLGVEEVA